MYNTNKQKENEDYLKYHFQREFKEPITHNVAVGCIFYRSTKQRIDVDNMLKNIMDAANGIVFVDDCQVTAKLGIIELDRERPRTVIVLGHHKSTMVRDIKTKWTCLTCEKNYHSKNGFSSNSKYCSRECWRNRKTKLKEITNCLECSDSFIKKSRTQIYCGESCRKSAQKKRNTRQRIHEKAYCNVCGKELSKPIYKRCRSCWTIKLQK